ncbi:hypothetical protein DFP72DRAFT_1063537 [Ephemerocybe angulata]|uniref:Uncharacterized protein n=1 Tax=Ephemerocybe angulata TaxID=980116 RepID=A0A8H6I6H4_9AGAR|nr:hypothetical protein DFP72DRAFT_1063537 [Tulosesus angulatus]
MAESHSSPAATFSELKLHSLSILGQVTSLGLHRQQMLLSYATSRVRAACVSFISRELIKNVAGVAYPLRSWDTYIRAEMESLACLMGTIALVMQAPDGVCPIRVPEFAKRVSEAMMRDSLEDYNTINDIVAIPVPEEEQVLRDYVNPWWKEMTGVSPVPSASLIIQYFIQQEKSMRPAITQGVQRGENMLRVMAMSEEELHSARNLARDTVEILDNEVSMSKKRLAMLNSKIEALHSLRSDLLAGHQEAELELASALLLQVEPVAIDANGTEENSASGSALVL